MWLKVAIVVLLLAMVASLINAFIALMKDKSGSPRLVWSLTSRVMFAGLILALILYGKMSGQLDVSAPWISTPEASQPQPQEQSQDINKQE